MAAAVAAAAKSFAHASTLNATSFTLEDDLGSPVASCPCFSWNFAEIACGCAEEPEIWPPLPCDLAFETLCLAKTDCGQ